MAEVAIAFPNDELMAGLLVSRLAAEGIAARIDRGLYGAYLAPQAGQLTILVDARDAGRARRILGTTAGARRRRR